MQTRATGFLEKKGICVNKFHPIDRDPNQCYAIGNTMNRSGQVRVFNVHIQSKLL